MLKSLKCVVKHWEKEVCDREGVWKKSLSDKISLLNLKDREGALTNEDFTQEVWMLLIFGLLWDPKFQCFTKIYG